jgi:dCMP deaminase
VNPTSDGFYARALRLAYSEAARSKDPSTQNGAAVFDAHGMLRGTGCNHIPGLPVGLHNAMMRDRELKYPRVVHAEVAAILDSRHDLRNGIMVCPWAACLGCTGAIIASGIKMLVVHKDRFAFKNPKWEDEIAESFRWFEFAGVQVLAYEGKLNATPIRCGGGVVHGF